ncbi:cytochrome P450 [Streptomyces sp. NPDC046994]|uniref:cytochrome P450 n=1 Tax=Streptomyces sp. NPDC046994 TaxID=3155735 RepID=UPI0034514845
MAQRPQAIPELPLSPRLQLHAWAHTPTALLEQGRDLQGTTFMLRAGERDPLVVLTDSASAQAAFRQTGADGMGAEANDVLLSLVGPTSVLVAQGADHRARRRELRPVVNSWGRTYGKELTTLADRLVASWPTGRPVALHSHCQRLTLDLLLHSLLGTADSLAADALRELVSLDLAANRSAERFAIDGPPPEPWPLLAARHAEFDAALYQTLAAGRPGYGAEQLGSATQGTGCLRDTLATVVITGHETAATALAWAIERLAHSPEATAEVERLVQSGCRTELERYLHLVILESLRQRPVIPLLTRRLSEPFNAAGHVLAEGTEVGIAAWLIHHDPDLHPQSARFMPERFESVPGLELPRAANADWIPFGGGTRRCLGDRFAVDVVRTGLLALVERYALVPGSESAEHPVRQSITIAPGAGCLVSLQPR